ARAGLVTSALRLLSLHDALPISDGILQGSDIGEAADLVRRLRPLALSAVDAMLARAMARHMHHVLGDHFSGMLEHIAAQHAEERSEEHTSELQSRENLVCRLLPA